MDSQRRGAPLSGATRIDEAVISQAAIRPDQTALVDGTDRIDYRTLAGLIENAAQWIDATAPQTGAIGLLLDNSAQAVVALLACFRLGRTVVPINTKNDTSTVRHIVENAGIGLLLVAPKLANPQADQEFGTQVVQIWADPGPDVANADPVVPRDPVQDAIVFYTSGSTGKPKGVVVTHSNLVHGADSVAHYLSVTPGLRIGAVLPVSFDAGLNWVMTGLASGAEVHLLRYVFPKSLANDLARFKIEAMLAVPTVFFALSEVAAPQDHTIRTMASTGGRMEASVVEKLKASYQGLEFVVMYGLTEAFRATHLPDALWAQNPTSIGRAIPHAAIHIMRDDSTEADIGETGEIVQSGPLVSNGYLNAPNAMKDRFGPCPPNSPYADTHPIAVYSGDFGYRDAAGLHYFVGRKDRLIKARGFRIAPEEIEKAMVAHCGLANVVVFGREHPSTGQRIVAVIESTQDSLPALATVRDTLRPHLSGYMLPDEVCGLEKFPLNSNGKFDVNKIVDLCTS